MRNPSNFVTIHALRKIKKGEIDLGQDKIMVHLLYEREILDQTAVVADKYTPNSTSITSHNFTDGQLLEGQVFKNGVFDAQDTLFKSIGTGLNNHTIAAIALCHVDTDTLIAIIRSPFINKRFYFNGGDILITWDNDPNKIFNIKKDLEKIE